MRWSDLEAGLRGFTTTTLLKWLNADFFNRFTPKSGLGADTNDPPLVKFAASLLVSWPALRSYAVLRGPTFLVDSWQIFPASREETYPLTGICFRGPPEQSAERDVQQISVRDYPSYPIVEP